MLRIMLGQHLLPLILGLLWLSVGMAGTIVVRCRTGAANVLTMLAAVLGPVLLLVALLLPARKADAAPALIEGQARFRP